MGRTIQERQLAVLAACEAAQRKTQRPTYELALDEAEVFALASLVRQAMATHGLPTPAARSVQFKTQALRSEAVDNRDPSIGTPASEMATD